MGYPRSEGQNHWEASKKCCGCEQCCASCLCVPKAREANVVLCGDFGRSGRNSFVPGGGFSDGGADNQLSEHRRNPVRWQFRPEEEKLPTRTGTGTGSGVQGYEQASTPALTWCAALCASCARCAFISVSEARRECRWYAACDPRNLSSPAAALGCLALLNHPGRAKRLLATDRSGGVDADLEPTKL